MMSDVNKYCGSCETCQLRARHPISIVRKLVKGKRSLTCIVMCSGLCSGQTKMCNSISRYPFACPLRSLHTKNIFHALMSIFEFTGIYRQFTGILWCVPWIMLQTFVLLLRMNFWNASAYHRCDTPSLFNRISSWRERYRWTQYSLWKAAIMGEVFRVMFIRVSVNGTTHVPPHCIRCITKRPINHS